MKKRIAIFASGSGSNAQKIMEHFKDNEIAEVALLLTNNPDAYVLQRADNFEIPSHIFSKQEFKEADEIIEILEKLKIDFLVLAGFLWLVPQKILKRFPNKILNIHPALLPAHGGKGMYGDRVHQAVIDAKDKESGITIHVINENFDEGETIFQARFKVSPEDTLEEVRFNGQQLEHLHYPNVIESYIKKIEK
jgi:phosphoribosylglycinamide formyltransferase-1